MPSKRTSASGKPGSADTRKAWDAEAAKANGGKPPKPVQTSLLIGGEIITVIESHAIEVAVSEDEARLLNAKSAECTAKAVVKETESKRLKETLIAPLDAEAKSLRKDAEQAAKEAAEHKRSVQQNVRVEYHLATATVRYFDPETGAKVMLDRAMTPAEMTRMGEATPPPAPLDPPDGEAIDVEESTTTKPGLGPANGAP